MSFLLPLWFRNCLEVAVDRILRISINHPPPPPSLLFFSILHAILSSTQVIIIRCCLAVNVSLLVTLRKVSRRASCKALRWDKVMTIRRVCIVQYRIVFSFHIFRYRLLRPRGGRELSEKCGVSKLPPPKKIITYENYTPPPSLAITALSTTSRPRLFFHPGALIS